MTASSRPPAERAAPFRLDIQAPPPLRGVVNGALESLLGLARLNRIYASLTPGAGPADFVAESLRALRVTFDVSSDDAARIPATGPLVVVANHPFGAVEGLVLLALLHRARPDVRILANRLLTVIPELREVLFDVDVLGTAPTRTSNRAALRNAVRWVEGGGCLAVFPSGAVAHARERGEVTDGPWNADAGAIARRGDATVVPVHFGGANGPLFHAAGMVHPFLRTALLPRELLNKAATTVRLRVGTPIRPERVASIPDDAELTAFLRLRTYLLARRSGAPQPPGARAAALPVASAEDPSSLAHEIASLPPSSSLVEHGALAVHLLTAAQAPVVVREVGRLREITFREVGEGTGRASDLDRFDDSYLHLVLWDAGARRVAGAYRMRATAAPLRLASPHGLYTASLFDLSDAFFARMGPAIELGRSFVAPEYQRSFAPLMLLWKAIGAYVVRNPHLRTLFGPVSISRRYGPFARQLMVEWLEHHAPADALAPLAAPRRPLRAPEPLVRAARTAASVLPAMDDLSDVVADVQPSLRGVPILLREYHRLGGRYAAFNVDPAFSDVVDGLVVIDLTRTEPRVLGRYMGKEAAAGFVAYHSGPCRASRPS